MPRWLGRALLLVLVLLVSVGIIRTLAPELQRITWADFARWRPRVWPLLLSTLLLVAVYLWHALLWRAITTTLGGAGPTLRATLRMYFLSALGRYIPGRLWQVAGMAVLAQRAGISAVAATAALFVAQFAFLTSGLVFLAVLLPAWAGGTPALIAAIALTFAAAFVYTLTATELGHDLRAWLTRKLGARLGNALQLIDRVDKRHALRWWLGYAGSWVLLGVAFVLFTTSFLPLDAAQQRHVAGTVAVSYLGGYLFFFTVAGLGVRESVMFGLLYQVMPAPAALVVSVASRVWFTAAELLPLLLIPATRDRS